MKADPKLRARINSIAATLGRDASLAKLDLPVRLYNFCKSEGVWTIGGLIDCIPGSVDLYSSMSLIPSVGPVTLREFADLNA